MLGTDFYVIAQKDEAIAEATLIEKVEVAANVVGKEWISAADNSRRDEKLELVD